MGADEIEYSSINLDNSVLSRKHITHTVLISLITLQLHRSKIKTKNALRRFYREYLKQISLPKITRSPCVT